MKTAEKKKKVLKKHIRKPRKKKASTKKPEKKHNWVLKDRQFSVNLCVYECKKCKKEHSVKPFSMFDPSEHATLLAMQVEDDCEV